MTREIDTEQLRRLAGGHDHIEMTADEALRIADALDEYYAIWEGDK